MLRWPRPLDDLDRRLGPDPPERESGLLACFAPVLPAQHTCDTTTWSALRMRFDDRHREWLGPVGDGIRALAVRGVIRLGTDGLLRDPRTGGALDRAAAEILAGGSARVE